MNGIVSIGADRQQIVRTIRVMVVDDQDAFRSCLRSLLDICQGFQVVTEACSCEEALTKAAESPIELILMDRFLPDGDSIKIIPALRQVGSAPNVVIFSANLEEEALIEALMSGASGYVTKDTMVNELDRLLQGFLRGELVMLPIISTLAIRLLLQLSNEQEKLLNNFAIVDPLASDQSIFTLAVLPASETTEQHPLKALTPQENKVYYLLSQGCSNKQIAARLSISPYTVGKHVQHILHKLGVTNRTQAVSYISSEGRGHFNSH